MPLTHSESNQGDRAKVATDSGHPGRTSLSGAGITQAPIPEGLNLTLKLPRKHPWQCEPGLPDAVTIDCTNDVPTEL